MRSNLLCIVPILVYVPPKRVELRGFGPLANYADRRLLAK
jgi:hypothetical protein